MEVLQQNVVSLELKVDSALRIIRGIIQDTSRVKFTFHARQRMEERGFSDRQIIKCLEHGRIIEGPSRSANGNWECRVEGIAAGDVITVACALDYDKRGNHILIITAY